MQEDPKTPFHGPSQGRRREGTLSPNPLNSGLKYHFYRLVRIDIFFIGAYTVCAISRSVAYRALFPGNERDWRDVWVVDCCRCVSLPVLYWRCSQQQHLRRKAK